MIDDYFIVILFLNSFESSVLIVLNQILIGQCEVGKQCEFFLFVMFLRKKGARNCRNFVCEKVFCLFLYMRKRVGLLGKQLTVTPKTAKKETNFMTKTAAFR